MVKNLYKPKYMNLKLVKQLLLKIEEEIDKYPSAIEINTPLTVFDR